VASPDGAQHRHWVPNVTAKQIDCGDWTQQEAPDETNQAILEFPLHLKLLPMRGPVARTCRAA